LLPLNALIFKVSFADGAPSPEKASSADSVAKGRSVVLRERRGSLLFKVILCFYNITKYIILYRFAAFIVIIVIMNENENTNHNK
jgi:hypothetical protein